jgi:hypothetical protein
VDLILPRNVDGGRGNVAQTMYTHVSKCKNDKKRRQKVKKSWRDRGRKTIGGSK